MQLLSQRRRLSNVHDQSITRFDRIVGRWVSRVFVPYFLWHDRFGRSEYVLVGDHVQTESVPILFVTRYLGRFCYLEDACVMFIGLTL